MNVTHNKKTQAGAFDVWWLFYVICLCATFYFWGMDWLPADAADVQSVVALSEKSAIAKKQVVDALKANPNPSRGDLRRLRLSINDVLVTATAREVTGDATLKTKAETEADESKQRAAVAAKPWKELDDGQKLERATSYAGFGVIVIAIVLGGAVGVRKIVGL